MNPIILYDNSLGNGEITATDTGTGYDADNVFDLREYTYWVASSVGTKYLAVDAGGVVYADTLGIAGHNLGTATAIVSLESSVTGAWAGEEVERVAGFIPLNDNILLKTFSAIYAQYWRLKIITSSIAAQIGVLSVGERLTFPSGPLAPTAPYTESIEAATEVSKAGNLLGVAIAYNPLAVKVKFRGLDYSWLWGDFKTFWDYHGKQLKPFFWSIDLDSFGAHYLRLSSKQTFSTPLYMGLLRGDKTTINMTGKCQNEPEPETESLILEVIIAADDLTMSIPCGDLGVYDAVIDWGDSSATTAVAYNSAGLSHTYAEAGAYIVKVSGTLPWLNFSSNSTEADKLGKVLSLGSVGAMSYQGILGGCSNLTWLGQMGTEAFPDVTSMAGAFSGDTALANLDVSSWNFENILDLTNFATGVTIPTAIYEATLISLAAQDVNSGLTVDFGNSIPESDAAMAARTFLVETKSWVILDWYLGPKIKLTVPLATVSVGTVVT